MSQTETIMLVALGFAIAALIALFLSRFFWAVALRLGNKRLLRSTPTTIAELRADRDRLRAEYAMLSRKLQLKMDNIKTRLAEQMAEVTRNRNRIDHLIAEVRTRDAMLAERDGEIANLKGHIAPLETELASRTQSIQSSREQLRGLDVELARRHKAVEKYRAEIAERDKRIETLRNESVGKDINYQLVSNEAFSAQERLRKRIEELTSLSSQIEEQRSHLAQQKTKFDSLRSELTMARRGPERHADDEIERQFRFASVAPEPTIDPEEPTAETPPAEAPFTLAPPEPEFIPEGPELLPSNPEFADEPEFLPPRHEFVRVEPEFVRVEPEFVRVEPEFVRVEPEFVRVEPELLPPNPEHGHSEHAMTEGELEHSPGSVRVDSADSDFATQEAAEDLPAPAPPLGDAAPDDLGVKAQLTATESEAREPDTEFRQPDRSLSARIAELKIDNADQAEPDAPRQPESEGESASAPARKLRAVTNVISLAARIRALQKTAGE